MAVRSGEEEESIDLCYGLSTEEVYISFEGSILDPHTTCAERHPVSGGESETSTASPVGMTVVSVGLGQSHVDP